MKIRMFTAAAALALASTASFAQEAVVPAVTAPAAPAANLGLLTTGANGVVLTSTGLAVVGGVTTIALVGALGGDSTVSTPSTN